jgi:hypothetical protein
VRSGKALPALQVSNTTGNLTRSVRSTRKATMTVTV